MEPINAKESAYLYVKDSMIRGAGSGLFTAIDIYKDEIICLFKGERLTQKEAEHRANLGLDGYFISLLTGQTLDSARTECYAKYANDPNGFIQSDFKNNAKISLTDQDEVCLFATKKIRSGEEIFCSYGEAYWVKQLKNKELGLIS